MSPDDPTDAQSGVVQLRPLALDPIIYRLRVERKRRLRAGDHDGQRWTQEWLAAQLAVTRPTLANWESGRAMPRLSQLRAWAALLDFDLILITRTEELVA